nr:MAG TPA: hypothetical protein [Caudoviricetes sp.]
MKIVAKKRTSNISRTEITRYKPMDRLGNKYTIYAPI